MQRELIKINADLVKFKIREGNNSVPKPDSNEKRNVEQSNKVKSED
jgi:hypothetical protein